MKALLVPRVEAAAMCSVPLAHWDAYVAEHATLRDARRYRGNRTFFLVRALERHVEEEIPRTRLVAVGVDVVNARRAGVAS